MWLGSRLGPGWVPRWVSAAPKSWVSTHSTAWGLVARNSLGFCLRGRHCFDFVSRGAVRALHKKSAGPVLLIKVSWNQAPQTDPSFRNAQVSWYETTLPSFLGGPELVAGVWKAGEGRGMGRGLEGGQGWHHIFPRGCLSGGAETPGVEGPAVNAAWPRPQPCQAAHPQASPGASICCPPPPSSAASGPHSPLNILRGLRCHPAPLHSAWTWDLAGTVTSRDTSAEHRGSEGRDSWGVKSQPQGGCCTPSGTSRLYR